MTKKYDCLQRILCLLFIFWISSVQAQSQDVDEEQLLQWTSSVGQMLYSYYSSYDVAIDAIRQQAGEEDIPRVYAGGPYDGGWAFSFGEIEENGEFILTYGVIVGQEGQVLNFDHFDFRRVASPHHTLAVHALLRVVADFEEYRNQNDQFLAEVFRYAVLPFPRGRLTAFVSPKQICKESTLVGNDMMYTLTREDGTIVNRTRFIHSLLTYPHELPENLVAAVLKVPQNPMPSPVDVLTAMERGQRVVVFAGSGAFMIEPDGAIHKLSKDDPMVKGLLESNQ